jgi:hypothetical protein
MVHQVKPNRGFHLRLLLLAPNGPARAFRRGLLSAVLRQSWAPCKITALIRLESPKSVARVTNLAPVLPLMTETNSELQSLLSQ